MVRGCVTRLVVRLNLLLVVVLAVAACSDPSCASSDARRDADSWRFGGAPVNYGFGIGVVVAANATAAEALTVSSYVDGAVIYVSTFEAPFRYVSSSSLTVDHVTVLATSAGGSTRFVRDTSFGHPKWLTVTDFYIDFTGGSDEAVGDSGHQLKTWAEYWRRVAPNYTRPQFTLQHLVHGQHDQPNGGKDDPICPRYTLLNGASWYFVGTPTTSASTTISAVTARSKSTNVPWKITASGGLSAIGRLEAIRNTTANTIAYGYYDNTGSVANQFFTGDWLHDSTVPSFTGYGTRTDPAINDNLVKLTLPGVNITCWDQEITGTTQTSTGASHTGGAQYIRAVSPGTNYVEAPIVIRGQGQMNFLTVIWDGPSYFYEAPWWTISDFWNNAWRSTASVNGHTLERGQWRVRGGYIANTMVATGGKDPYETMEYRDDVIAEYGFGANGPGYSIVRDVQLGGPNTGGHSRTGGGGLFVAGGSVVMTGSLWGLTDDAAPINLPQGATVLCQSGYHWYAAGSTSDPVRTGTSNQFRRFATGAGQIWWDALMTLDSQATFEGTFAGHAMRPDLNVGIHLW